jgi:predicted metalloprotease
MNDYLNVIIPIVENFYRATWVNMPLPSHIYFIQVGQTIAESCTDNSGNPAAGDENSYEYCPDDNNVYIGQAMIWRLYSQDGDIAPAVGLAHELGHDAQTHTGVPAPQTDSQTEVHENQADCVSGAFIGYEEKLGDLQPSDDIPSLERYINTIADATNDPSPTHGNSTVRTNAINYGWRNGISGCNGYYPSTPIIT